MKEVKNKDEFFKIVDKLLKPGYSLTPIMLMRNYILWLSSRYYDKEEFSNDEIYSYIQDRHKVVELEGVKCVRINEEDTQTSDNQYGINEQKCTFEQAVYLKKLGFNETVPMCYQVIGKYVNVIDYHIQFPEKNSEYVCCDLNMVAEWIRLKYNIVITVYPNLDIHGFYPLVYTRDEDGKCINKMDFGMDFSKPIWALSYAITEVLKMKLNHDL